MESSTLTAERFSQTVSGELPGGREQEEEKRSVNASWKSS